MTFDLVTDWINWKQWLEVGGYSFHYLVFVFKTTFLCVAVVGTVIFTTETIVIVLKLFRIHRMETSDIENPSDERRVSPQEIRGFYEQETKVNEAEKAVKKIIEEQEKKLEEIDKSPPGKVRDGSEEQEERPNEGNISPPGNVRNYSQEQEETLNEGDISSPGKVRDESEEEEEKLNETNKSSPGNVRDDRKEEEELDKAEKSSAEKLREDSEEQEEELNEGDKSSPGKVRNDSQEQEEELIEGDKSSPGNMRNDSVELYEVGGEKCIYRLAIILLILTGFLEDFPVVIVTFYTATSTACGMPARQEGGSVLTMTTIISAMMNSLWTMIILFGELCDCQKLYRNISYRCCAKIKYITIKKTFKTLCQKTCCQKSTNLRLSKHHWKGYLIKFGKTLLFGFIFLLFSGNFAMGMLTIGHISGFISLRPIGITFPFYLTHSVPTGPLGPGLDGKRDEAMFIYNLIGLRSPHQVVLYDDKGNVKGRSIWTNQILNRLYIGQFEELSHLKGGNLTKAIPCSRIFPFGDKFEESLLVQNVSMQSLYINVSDCKLIFNIRYYPVNNDWNPFKDILHGFYKYITIEWGIYVSNKNSCPWAITALRANDTDVLTSDIKDNLIKYTCSSACGDDANICDNAHHLTFRSSRQTINAYVPPRLFLAINDLKVADSCIFHAVFEYSQKFCDESWSTTQTVDVPQEIQDAYPQFITIPELYRLDKERETLVPKYFCNEMWNSSMSCCADPEDFRYNITM